MAPRRKPETLYETFHGHLSGDRSKQKRVENLEVGLGFLGFFTLMSLVALVVAELQGKAAVVEALVALLFCSLTFVVYRRWRRMGT